MGLRDWLAKNVAGASGYGNAIGRQAVTGGLALGRFLYLGHGTRATPSDVVVFEDADHLRSEGFELYCPDDLHMPPSEDSSELSKHTRAAGVAFALECGRAAAENFVEQQNGSAFVQSMGSAATNQLRELNSGVTADLVEGYLRLSRPSGITDLLNWKKPGTNDLLFVFLREVTRHSQDAAVGFQRGGVLGYGVVAVPLVEESVKMVSAATQKFGW
jgi:hypothetical protein